MAEHYEATVSWASTASMGTTGGYKLGIPLKAGWRYKVSKFYVQAYTTYAAVDTNYNVYVLRNSSGYAIASVANGPATGGLAIGPTVLTGICTSFTDAYENIEATSDTFVYVDAEQVGVGLAVGYPTFTVYFERERLAS